MEKNCFREGKGFELVDMPVLKEVNAFEGCFYPAALVRFESWGYVGVVKVRFACTGDDHSGLWSNVGRL